MQIKLSGTRGRTEINTTIDVDNLSDEENLQEFIVGIMDFAKAMGAELPDEIEQIIEDYNGDC